MSSDKVFKFRLTHSSGFSYMYEGTLEALKSHLLINPGSKIESEEEAL